LVDDRKRSTDDVIHRRTRIAGPEDVHAAGIAAAMAMREKSADRALIRRKRWCRLRTAQRLVEAVGRVDGQGVAPMWCTHAERELIPHCDVLQRDSLHNHGCFAG